MGPLLANMKACMQIKDVLIPKNVINLDTNPNQNLGFGLPKLFPPKSLIGIWIIKGLDLSKFIQLKKILYLCTYLFFFYLNK